LRSLGHNLKPVVTITSNSLSDNIMLEINRALVDHELIKVKFTVVDQDTKYRLIEAICRQAPALLLQKTGHVALIYRHNPHADTKKSNLYC